PAPAAAPAAGAAPAKTEDEGIPGAFTPDETEALKALAAAGPELLELLRSLAAAKESGEPPAPAAAAAPAKSADEGAPPVAEEKSMDSAAVARVVADTVKLHKEAEEVLGEKFDSSKTNRELQIQVIKSLDSKWTDA